MTEISDFARAAAGIANRAGNDVDAISIVELAGIAHALSSASAASGQLLLHRCGGDHESARVTLSRAMDLPDTVLRRRAKEAEDVITEGDLPSIPQHAAHTALMIKEARAIYARIESA